MSALLAQHHATPDDYSLALSIMALVGMIIPFVVFAVVCWVFWKAKKREDAAREREISGPTGDVLRSLGGR